MQRKHGSFFSFRFCKSKTLTVENFPGVDFLSDVNKDGIEVFYVSRVGFDKVPLAWNAGQLFDFSLIFWQL